MCPGGFGYQPQRLAIVRLGFPDLLPRHQQVSKEDVSIGKAGIRLQCRLQLALRPIDLATLT